MSHDPLRRPVQVSGARSSGTAAVLAVTVVVAIAVTMMNLIVDTNVGPRPGLRRASRSRPVVDASSALVLGD